MAEVTLDDVRKVSPAEDPEEKKVMDYLERNNVTGSSQRFFDAATSIPSEVASQVSTKSERFEGSNSEESQEKDVDDELFDLTNNINRLHYDMHQSQQEDSENPIPVGDKRKSKRPLFPGRIFKGSEDAPQSEGDRFAANAGKIFSGFAKKNKKRGILRRNNNKSDPAFGSSGDIESNISGGKHASYAKKVKIASIESIHDFKSLVGAKKGYVWSYIRDSLFFIIIPSTIVAAILFYFLGNPEFGESLSFDDVTRYFSTPTDPPTILSGEPTPAPSTVGISASFDPSRCRYWKGVKGPTISWWLLFLGVRQVITLGLARAAQYVVIHYALKINFSGLMGPTVRLFLLQAKGWPFVTISWAVLNFALLYGSRRFSSHWLFYQEWVELFNECNPSGSVTSNPNYGALLVYAIFLGVLVAIKRFFLGLRFGKASYIRYAEKLSQILKDLLLISRVVKVSRYEYYSDLNREEMDDNSVLDFWYKAGDGQEGDDEFLPMEEIPVDPKQTKGRHKRSYTAMTVDSAAFLTPEQNENIKDLLGEWTDLDLADGAMDTEADLASIIQFRASIGVLESNMPYSPGFGIARTRKEVIEGSERLYNALVKKQQFLESNFLPPTVPAGLRFHTIALTSLRKSGVFDEKECKALVKLFRPGRDGSISKLEFCKSIDEQYKELRKLRANIVNEGKVNIASERIINFLFYGVMFIIGLSVLGIDPLALFGLFTSVILGFSFMIGGASADVFRGLLFITLQRPYDIGDRVNVSGAATDSSGNGASGWIVKDINLYHTTFIFGTTNEYATISNGALSNARIINAARSPLAALNFVMKFGLDVPASTIQIFKEELMAYIKARPREWLSFNAFRMTRIEANSGFIEYKIVVQHRESWQQVGGLLNSLADFQAFAFERSRALNMAYKAPCMPVELKMLGDERSAPPEQGLARPPIIQSRQSTGGSASSPFRQSLFFGNGR